MPTLDFHRLQGAVLVRATGPLGARGLLDAIHRLLADPRYHPGMPALWDLRDSDLETMTAAAMRLVRQETLPYQEVLSRARVALLVSSELAFGVARMYEVLAMGDMLEHRSFRDPDAAERWIREGMEEGAVEARAG